MVQFKFKKSVLLVSLLLFSLFSNQVNYYENDLNEETSSNNYSVDIDGEFGTLINGWAVTGESISSIQSDKLNDFDVSSNGDIFVVGSFSESETLGDFELNHQSENDGFLAKISEIGDWIDVKVFSNIDDLSVEKISLNSDGKIAIAGHFSGNSMTCDELSVDNKNGGTGSSDVFIATLDSDLNCLWLNSLGGEQDDTVNDILIRDDGTVFLAGIVQDIVYFNEQGTDGLDEDGFICKFSEEGSLNWGHRINGVNDQSANSIFIDTEENIFVGGDSDANAEINGGGENKSTTDAGFILKINLAGDLFSLEGIPGVVTKIAGNSLNNQIYVGGTFSGMKFFDDTSVTSSGYRDVFIAKYEFPSGFTNLYTISSNDVVDLKSFDIDSEGNILLVGSWGKFFQDYNLFFDDLSIEANDYTDSYLAKLDPENGWIYALRGTSNRDDYINNVVEDNQGSIIIGGTFAVSHDGSLENTAPSGFEFFDTVLNPTSRQSHMFIWKLLVDPDQDGIGKMNDLCEDGKSDWISTPNNDRDSDGCFDETEDLDDDGDGFIDDIDECPRGEINWVSDKFTDPNSDGCKEDYEGKFLNGDLDSDGVIDGLDPLITSPVIRNSPSQGTEIENFPLNLTYNRTDYSGSIPLLLLGNGINSYTTSKDAWFDVDGDGDYDYVVDGKIFRTVNGILDTGASMRYCDGQGCDGPLAVGDIDGDGKLDLVDGKGVHLNKGNGFTDSLDWTFDETCSGTVTEVSLGDLDADDKADLYVGYQGSDDCIYYTSNAESNQLFGTGITVSGKLGTTKTVKIVDFNLDGKKDVVRLIKASSLQVIFNSGDNNPISSEVSFQTLPIAGGESFDLGDLDADGDLDVVVATNFQNHDKIYLNNESNGLHNFTLEWQSFYTTSHISSKVSDIDGDGDLDFSFGGTTTEQIFLNPSTGVNLDSDFDGLNDEVDNCNYSRNYYTNILIDLDEDGCHDILDDDDDDGDGISDDDDLCPSGFTGWMSNTMTDLDGDGCRTEEDIDSDGDGVYDELDICPFSEQDRIWEVDVLGVEYDQDGVPGEEGSEIGCHPGESDKDKDGVVDELDALPTDKTQDSDFDGDGFYDNPPPSTLADNCPLNWGTSTMDKKGCPDLDGDGWSDEGDKFPFDGNKWADPTDDTDSDTILDVDDDCPTFAGSSTKDRLGCFDSDGDGWSNEDDIWKISDGADAFPDDPTRHISSDDSSNDNDVNGNNTTNGTGNGVDNGGDNLDLSADSNLVLFVGIGLSVLVVIIVIIVFLMRNKDDEDDYHDEYAEELLSDEEVVKGLFRKKTRKKVRDDHGYASKKANVEFGQRPGARPTMQSGQQKQYQDTGYYGEESRYDSYYGGSGGSANVGSGYTPTNDLRGNVGDDGYEWLEFPENSDRWWWRERSGDSWSAWE